MRDPVWNKIIGFFLATGAFYVTLKVDPPPPTVIFCTCFLTDALAAVARYHGGIFLVLLMLLPACVCALYTFC